MEGETNNQEKAKLGRRKQITFNFELRKSSTGFAVFLTDDSGVGGDHIEPSVGDFQVEPLNDLLVRLIAKYIG